LPITGFANGPTYTRDFFTSEGKSMDFASTLGLVRHECWGWKALFRRRLKARREAGTDRAARWPFGAARDLNEVIEFDNQRFQMILTHQEKQDVIAFLNSLQRLVLLQTSAVASFGGACRS
jgi:hypothetical protein